MKSITLLSLATFLAACDSDVTVFGGGGQGEGNGPSTGGAPPSAGGQSSNGGSSTSDGGASTSDGGASAQGGGTVVVDGGGPSMGGAPPSTTINCGMTSCDAATQQCCGTQGGASCIDIGDDCPGVVLSCSSAANCTGDDVCCLSGSGPGDAEAVCAPQCKGGGGPGGGSIQLCQDSAECPPNIDCVEIFGGFFACDPGFGP